MDSSESRAARLIALIEMLEEDSAPVRLREGSARTAELPATPTPSAHASDEEAQQAELVDVESGEDLPASLLESKGLWLASFVALGVADFGSVVQLASSSFGVLDGLGVAGGAGLIATSATGLKKSKTTEDRLDTANNIAWGGQGLLYLLPSTAGVLGTGLAFGLVGSAMQTGVGLIRVQRGLVARDHAMVKLGVLDVGGGLLWLAWDLVGLRQPLFVGAYIATKAGREAYANREALQNLFASLKAKALGTYDRALDALDTVWPAPAREPQ